LGQIITAFTSPDISMAFYEFGLFYLFFKKATFVLFLELSHALC